MVLPLPAPQAGYTALPVRGTGIEWVIEQIDRKSEIFMDVEQNRPLVSDRIMMEERSIAAVSTPPTVTGDYEIDRQRHVRAFQERLPGEVEKMTWPLERMHALRDERLRALIRTAKERSPWHARRRRCSHLRACRQG